MIFIFEKFRLVDIIFFEQFYLVDMIFMCIIVKFRLFDMMFIFEQFRLVDMGYFHSDFKFSCLRDKYKFMKHP